MKDLLRYSHVISFLSNLLQGGNCDYQGRMKFNDGISLNKDV